MTGLIRQLYHESKQSYGSPRITQSLKQLAVFDDSIKLGQETGWALSHSLQASTTSVAALRMALQRRPLTQELIFHSDRGVQDACEEFRKELRAPIRQSMNRKANCWDNAVAESFFKTLKTKCVYHYYFENRQAAAITIFEYIETWYNRKRIHASLNS